MLRNILTGSLEPGVVAMSGADTAYNYDRYRKLLADADDEAKRLAFIELLIEERARDRLAQHTLRARLSTFAKAEKPSHDRSR
jgi:hypothetical protein